MSGELPEGWASSTLDELNEPSSPIGYGVLKPGPATEDGVVMLRVKDVRDGGIQLDDVHRITPALDDEFMRSRIRPGDIIISVQGSVGRVARVPDELNGANISRTLARIRPLSRDLTPWLWACLQTPQAQQRMGAVIGGTTRDSLNIRDLRLLEVPVPPRDEQHRIVDQVEALLADVNKAKERIVRVPLILKRFRQSVLAAACSGELTREWRETQRELQAPPAQPAGLTPASRQGRLWGAGEVPDLTDEERSSVPSNWSWMKVADLGSTPEDAVQIGPMSMKSSDFVESGTTVLNVGCVQPGWVDVSKCDHLPSLVAAKFGRYSIKVNDVLFTRSGTVGRCAVATKEHDGAIMTFHLLRVRPDQTRCRSRYLWAVFQGAPSIRRQTGEGQIGSTRAGFNTRLLASLDVPVPPLLEQDEIIRRVDDLFALADTIERRVKIAQARADKLPQAILSKAFSGELVPTEAELARAEGRDYETAEQLLARVRGPTGGEEQAKRAKAPARRKRQRVTEE